MNSQNQHWPSVPLAPWQDTCDTLHHWSQIVGKIRLSHMPWLNHSWHVTLYVTSNGLTTSLIPYGSSAFEILFDFIDHRLLIGTSLGERRSFSLYPMSVAEFYRKIMSALRELEIETHIWPLPVEISGSTKPFYEIEEKASYDSGASNVFGEPYCKFTAYSPFSVPNTWEK